MATSSGDPTARYLSTLDPRFKRQVIPFINTVRSVGVPLIVISGRRSTSAQARLVNAGITTATRSRHLSGQAVDVQVRGLLRSQVPPVWWDWIGRVGEWYGLRWGGRFRQPDLNHFDVG